jgi:hypothetical protein
MTTTITPNIEALDLRPIIELRPESERLIERLRADDVTAADRARYLIKLEAGILEAVRSAVHEFTEGSPERVIDEIDEAVDIVVNALGTGHLDYELHEMILRVYEAENGATPDDAVGLRGFDGWVHLVEYVKGGLSLVRFPATGEERRVGSGQLRPTPTRSDEVAHLTWWEREIWCNPEHGTHV